MTGRAAAATAGIATAVAATWAAGDPLTWLGALDCAAGAALLGGGAFALAGRRAASEKRVPVLLVVAGLAWVAGTVAPAVAVLLTLHRGPLLHAALAHPDGRTAGRAAAATVALAWVDGAVPAIAASREATLFLAGLVGAVALHAARSARGPSRPARRAGSLAAVALVAAPAAGVVLAPAGSGGQDAVLAAYDIAVVAGALVLARGWSPRGIAGLVVELGSARGGGTLNRALGGALGDPDLTVAYRAPGGGHIDGAGRPVALDEPGEGRVVTPLVHAGEPIGALIHDPAVLDDRALVEAVAATARLAVENVRLRARVQAEIAALAASRGRLVEAAAQERRRLAAALEAGAMRELAAVGRALDGVPGGDAALAELGLARADVLRLAEGLAPLALPAGGLKAALEDRTRALPLAVELDIPPAPLAPEAETALGFVCAEALANVAKHARASRVSITLTRERGALVLQVADDGVGGADPRGSGLAGVGRRLEALGGRLTLAGANGGGTLLRAELPEAFARSAEAAL
jgi:signal transduction histidine kinase